MRFAALGWDFGDGVGTDSGKLKESHIYYAPGTYVVRVTGIPESGGASVTATLTITLQF